MGLTRGHHAHLWHAVAVGRMFKMQTLQVEERNTQIARGEALFARDDLELQSLRGLVLDQPHENALAVGRNEKDVGGVIEQLAVRDLP